MSEFWDKTQNCEKKKIWILSLGPELKSDFSEFNLRNVSLQSELKKIFLIIMILIS